jgi:hypothetical protein
VDWCFVRITKERGEEQRIEAVIAWERFGIVSVGP